MTGIKEPEDCWDLQAPLDSRPALPSSQETCGNLTPFGPKSPDKTKTYCSIRTSPSICRTSSEQRGGHWSNLSPRPVVASRIGAAPQQVLALPLNPDTDTDTSSTGHFLSFGLQSLIALCSSALSFAPCGPPCHTWSPSLSLASSEKCKQEVENCPPWLCRGNLSGSGD
ncbi:unnamed protein product [Pleuronectes platessa]|uniref:Uncharacterized protein n=1 Tax=Pleuronectes platessa TaxID=8262 RepID=A0A9N7YM22_PLEPL|nr:unnamed protein product [Pleuronectes platessa]